MRSLPPTPFAGDLGHADPELEARLRAHQAGDASQADVLVALCRSRLLVPVVATATGVETGESGHVQEKSTDMEVVLWKRPTDGRVALLAFTALATLQAWNAGARPSPVSAVDAARVARSEAASALLIDVAGPVRFVVEGDDLVHLASGHALVDVGGGHAWVQTVGGAAD
jgi:hypothetical protein